MTSSDQDTSANILVIDDEEGIREGCRRVLGRAKYRVHTCDNGSEALSMLKKLSIDIVLLDLKMPGMDGIEVLKYISDLSDEILVIIITGYATVEAAVETLKMGAYDLLPKPFQTDHLRIVVGRAWDKISLTRETKLLEEQRQKSLLDLDAEKSRLRTIVESLPDGMLVTNSEGRVVLMNKSFLMSAELDLETQPGSLIDFYVTNETLIDLVREVSNCESNLDSLLIREIQLSDTSYHLAEGRRIIDANGECFGGVITLVDITAMKSLDRLKTDYVSRITHELRSPLATIYNQLTEVLGDIDEKSQLRDQYLLSRAVERTDGLISLVGDLLDLSRIEEGSFGKTTKKVNVGDLVFDITEFLRAQCESKNQTLALQLPKEPIPEISMDPLALESVIGNLIANAIKYTPENGTIDVSACSGNNELSISVSDTGIGIPENEKEKIFERFYRIKNDSTRRIVGTGLGLPIVKALVNEMGGEIDVRSTEGRGSTFTVTLPWDGAMSSD